MNKKAIGISTFALLLSNFMGGLDSTIINTALPTIMNDLDGIEELGLLTSIFLFFLAITTVLWGKLAEKIGSKKSFEISTFIFISASLTGGFSNNIWMLIISRGAMGFGAGGMISIPFIIYAQMYTDRVERARALGWVTASYGISTILGPLIGGIIVDTLGWRWTFFVNFPIGLISILLIHFFYQEVTKIVNNKKIDYLGIGLLIFFLAILLFIIEYGQSIHHFTLLILILLTIMSILAFLFVEKKAEDPIVPIELLKNFSYIAKSVMLMLFYGLSIGFTIYAPMWAQSILGTNATLSGLTQILSSIMVIIATRLTPSLIKRVPDKNIVWIGFLSVLIASIILVIAPFNARYLILVVSGGFLGFGQGLIFPPVQVAIQNEVKPELLNIATTLSLLLRTLAMTIMAAVFGELLSNHIVSSVNQSNGQISIDMVNGLNMNSVQKYGENLVTQMRQIVYSGLHLIFVIGLISIVLAIIINQFSWKNDSFEK